MAGFFMPEHKSMVKKAKIESLQTSKPILDEMQLQEINDLLLQSVLEELEVIITLLPDVFTFWGVLRYSKCKTERYFFFY